MQPRLVVPVVLGLAAALAARPSTGADDLAARTKAAIEKGVAWLKAQETKDGAWSYENLHPKLGEKNYPMSQGVAALGGLALVKAGVPRDDPAVRKALAHVRAVPIEHVYSAGLLILFLEAASPPGKVEAQDLDLVRRAVAFLEKNQKRSLWRYPSASAGEDSSNAQYALLGLDAATRLGAAVSPKVWLKAQEFFVECQEKDGPEVPAFPVCGADHSIAELRAIEKELKEKAEKLEKAFKAKKPGDTDERGRTKEDLQRLAEEEAGRRLLGTREKLPKMRARGFPYARPDEGEEPSDRSVTGSMTASGLAGLFVCKAHLDGTPEWKPIEASANAALRDGAAWLARSWSVKGNPKRTIHHLYYLYALERAAVLCIVPRFGEHDWYAEGAEAILKLQQPDGSFDAGKHTTVGPTVDTMFALLFLARGTTPVIKLPERVVTGPR